MPSPTAIRRRRGLILQILRVHRDLGDVESGFLYAAARERVPNYTRPESEADLDYLKQEGLVKLHRNPDPITGERQTFVDLSNDGIDVLEGNKDCPAGIEI